MFWNFAGADGELKEDAVDPVGFNVFNVFVKSLNFATLVLAEPFFLISATIVFGSNFISFIELLNAELQVEAEEIDDTDDDDGFGDFVGDFFFHSFFQSQTISFIFLDFT